MLYQSTFEGRQYFVLDSLTGNIIEEMGSEFSQISKLREEVMRSDFTNTFLYPQPFNDNLESGDVPKSMKGLLTEIKVVGKINWLVLKDLIMFNYHEQNSNGTFNNYFKVFDLLKQKYILNETLNLKAKNLVPESFFVVEDLIFLLVEKTKLVVYRIMQ